MADQQELQEPDVIHQNPIEAPPEYSSDPPDFSVLRIHSSPPPTAASRRHSPCSSCGCAGGARSRKRPSPCTSLPAKKLFLDHPPEHHRLCRSASDPDPFRPAAVPSPAPTPTQTVSAVSLAPGSASASRSLPPRPPPTLRRAASDPIPSPPVAPKSLSRTSSSASDEIDKTPNSKTGQMLSHWREINHWMEDFIRDEHSESENLTTTTTTTTTTSTSEDLNNDNGDAENFEINTSKEEDCAAESEESLSVERDGERLHIHFKCHCGKGYQFLLADGNCFYKLM